MNNSASLKMFNIGEFSKITGLTVKTIRLYHAKKIVMPRYVDSGSGYRYYDKKCIDVAMAVIHLKKMNFSLEQIREILTEYDDQSDILKYLELKKEEIRNQIEDLKSSISLLDDILKQEERVKKIMKTNIFDVEEKMLDSVLIACIRMKGRYADCSSGFAKIGKSLGRYLCGVPMMLHYDQEYKEEDADFEVAFPVRQEKPVDGISFRELPAGRCYSLLHRGPYSTLGSSYAKIIGFIKDKGEVPVIPSREVYLKGPSMIFKGNPKKYLTEIQFIIQDDN